MKKEAEIISKIIADNLFEKASKISPLIGKGFVNQVFLVEISNFKLIVRINNECSFDEYQKEVWVSSQALKEFIPTPKILKIGVFEKKAFSIQEFVQGVVGIEFPDKHFIWKKFGEYARQIHKIKVGGFGLCFRDMTHGNAETGWLKHLNYNIESLNVEDDLLKLNVFTKHQSETAKNMFENLKLKKFNFGLNHGDLSLKNSIIDELGIVHLIDWGSAEAGIVPHHDLVELLKINMEENNPDDSEIMSFLEGYGIELDEYKEMLSDLESLLLLRSLDKLRWAIDWEISGLEDYLLHAQKVIEKVLN